MAEEQQEQPQSEAILAGGLQVISGTMPVVGGPYDGQIVPVICFRFHESGGTGIYPDIILAVERRELRTLWQQVRDVGNASILQADRQNPTRPKGPKRKKPR